MITVSVDGVEQPLSEISESWLTEQILRRRADGVSICIRITIRTADLNIALATAGCPWGGASRPPTPEEQRILDLWGQHRLGEDNFAPPRLITFLKQIQSMC